MKISYVCKYQIASRKQSQDFGAFKVKNSAEGRAVLKKVGEHLELDQTHYDVNGEWLVHTYEDLINIATLPDNLKPHFTHFLVTEAPLLKWSDVAGKGKEHIEKILDIGLEQCKKFGEIWDNAGNLGVSVQDIFHPKIKA